MCSLVNSVLIVAEKVTNCHLCCLRNIATATLHAFVSLSVSLISSKQKSIRSLPNCSLIIKGSQFIIVTSGSKRCSRKGFTHEEVFAVNVPPSYHQTKTKTKKNYWYCRCLDLIQFRLKSPPPSPSTVWLMMLVSKTICLKWASPLGLKRHGRLTLFLLLFAFGKLFEPLALLKKLQHLDMV